MENRAIETAPGSVSDLLTAVVHEGHAFVRAETALLKIEARETLKVAVLFLVLTIASGLLRGGKNVRRTLDAVSTTAHRTSTTAVTVDLTSMNRLILSPAAR